MLTNSSAEFGLFWGADLYQYMDNKPPIIENFLYKNDAICIFAQPGVGKSILALELMSNLTTGEPLLGTYAIPHPQNVMYIQTEGDRAETIERITNMKRGIAIDDERWAHMNLPGLAINTEKGYEELNRLMEGCPIPIHVIILDPLYTTVKGSMINDDVATDWIRNLRRIKEKYDCSIIVNHHEGKIGYSSDGTAIDRGAANVFGSNFWAAFFNSTYRLKRSSQDSFILESGKQRSGKIFDSIAMKLLEPVPLMFVHSDDLDSSTRMARLDIILKSEATKWFTINQLQKLLGASRATVYRAIGELKGKRLVDVKHDNGLAYYKGVVNG